MSVSNSDLSIWFCKQLYMAILIMRAAVLSVSKTSNNKGVSFFAVNQCNQMMSFHFPFHSMLRDELGYWRRLKGCLCKCCHFDIRCDQRLGGKCYILYIFYLHRISILGSVLSKHRSSTCFLIIYYKERVRKVSFQWMLTLFGAIYGLQKLN